jgi:hypothetical protein
LANSFTLKMDVTWTFETLVDCQRTTRRYILEDRTLHFDGVCPKPVSESNSVEFYTISPNFYRKLLK